MKACFVPIWPAEAVRPPRAEIEAAEGEPELYLSGREDFLIEEDFDRRACGLGDGSGCDLVAIAATLTVESRVECNYWMLSGVYNKEFGARPTEGEDAFFGGELMLDEFETRILAPGDGVVRGRLDVQTPKAKRDFDRWWADLNAWHPSETGTGAQRRHRFGEPVKRTRAHATSSTCRGAP